MHNTCFYTTRYAYVKCKISITVCDAKHNQGNRKMLCRMLYQYELQLSLSFVDDQVIKLQMNRLSSPLTFDATVVCAVNPRY